MKPKPTHFGIAAVIAGAVYALTLLALPRNAITVEVYTSGGNVVGEKVISDPCHTGMASWGAFAGNRSRAYIPCDDAPAF